VKRKLVRDSGDRTENVEAKNLKESVKASEEAEDKL
jgi:hypothetical protein